MKEWLEKNLRRHLFSALAVILCVAAIVLFIRSRGAVRTDDLTALQAVSRAARWYPACFIGALLSTAAVYVVGKIKELIADMPSDEA